MNVTEAVLSYCALLGHDVESEKLRVLNEKLGLQDLKSAEHDLIERNFQTWKR